MMLGGTAVRRVAGLRAVAARRCGPCSTWPSSAGLAGFGAYIYALAHLPVSFVSLYAYINPVIAVALGALLLGEPFTLAHGDGRRHHPRGHGDRVAREREAALRHAPEGWTAEGLRLRTAGRPSPP